ncbi:DNA (cytosine-5-)-methyltransferase [Coprococcus comes]|uniref:DNA (cytosine-5-)-methyltransferase n=1 Tax=Coprococcus comes TaxID=410072 RepID=UPI001FAC1B68|nr:DNA (cytosine-5-)-methyltransferase [Coprococcus comes]
MKKEEFIKLAPKCGYGSEDRARDYTERNPKMHYSVDDFIKLYHEPIDSMHWNGIRATKGLYEMYGINGRTTAKRNGVAGDVRVKFIDWFAGIGGFRRGMELAGHECVGFCEFDKFATASYISMHLLTDEQRKKLDELPQKKRQKEILKDEYRNGEWYANDVRRVCADDIPKADCWCFGFPCQDISVAGKQLGFQGNRSSLFFRVMYLIGQLKEEDKPTYLFIENVKNLLSVNGGWDFARLLIEMEQGGYDAEWQVLNSKDFGVPQNRERCFIIGHLRGRSTAKVFPVERADGENRVQIIGHKDGYRRNTQVFDQNGITETLDTAQGGGRGHHVALPCFIDLAYQGKPVTTDVSRTILARYYKGCSNIHENSGIAIPILTPDRAEKRQNGRRFKEDGEPMFTLTGQDRHGVGINPLGVLRNVRSDYGKEIRKDYETGNIKISRCEFLESEVRDDGVVNTLSTVQKDNQLAVKVAEATKQGYSECRVGVDSVNLSVPGSKTRRGRVGHDLANTLDTSCNQGIFVQVSEELTVYAVWYEKYQCYIAIRRLTPKECFRLQGWTDDYFEKAEFVNSDSQLYKQAGNGVTVSVIQAIAERMKINDAERIS